MISIIVLVKDVRDLAAGCLQSLLVSLRALGLERDAEYVLADDFSRPERRIVELFQQFRAATPTPVTILRFKSHQHYGKALAQAMSLARGDHVLFFSHDMLVPPQCIRILLAVAASDRRHGIVRPVSQHMDGAEKVAVQPPFPLTHGDQIGAFSAMVARCHGIGLAIPSALVGDAMLIRRDVIERIGVVDPRYPGLLADVDYGVRARRAGFDHVIARGAWLHHIGKGLLRDAHARGPAMSAAMNAQALAGLDQSWETFRDKWGANRLPDRFADFGDKELAMLGKPQVEGLGENDYQAPVTLNPQVCEQL